MCEVNKMFSHSMEMFFLFWLALPVMQPQKMEGSRNPWFMNRKLINEETHSPGASQRGRSFVQRRRLVGELNFGQPSKVKLEQVVKSDCNLAN